MALPPPTVGPPLSLLPEYLGGFDSCHCDKFSPCFTIFPRWKIPLKAFQTKAVSGVFPKDVPFGLSEEEGLPASWFSLNPCLSGFEFPRP